MDSFSRDDLRALLDSRPGPCVSVFMPTTRGAALEDKKRWKARLKEAEEGLLAAGGRGDDARELLGPARALGEDVPFWQNVSAGLAVFLAPGFVRSYRLPLAFSDQVAIGDQFQVKPLVPFLSGDGRFFILALSQKHVRLLLGTRYTVQEVELHDMPTSMGQALQYTGAFVERTYHTHSAPGGPAGSREKIAQGQGFRIDSAKDGILQYFQAVDRGLHRYLRDEQAPLVLAADDFLHPIYREANRYPHLLAEGVPGHPDRLSDRELHDRAWEVVRPHFVEERERIAGLYRRLAGTGRTADELAEVVAAAYQGRVQYLFADLTRQQWGRFDPESLKTEVHAKPAPGDVDLTNAAVAHALAHKATVFADEPGLADGSGLAAVYWLPLGERSSKRRI